MLFFTDNNIKNIERTLEQAGRLLSSSPEMSYILLRQIEPDLMKLNADNWRVRIYNRLIQEYLAERVIDRFP